VIRSKYRCGEAARQILSDLSCSPYVRAIRRLGSIELVPVASELGCRPRPAADRNRYVGDNTPRALLDELLNQRFAGERACLIVPARALTKPVAPGVPDGSYDRCAVAAPALVLTDERGTTNLTVADRWGNVVEYTLTIEQIGGNAMVVPGPGFLLNNELTDFNFTPTQWQRGRCEPAGTGQAAAQLDGTDDPAPPEA
jgi:gamma-glutamyltranspeptidase